jgi:hypothetical protein
MVSAAQARISLHTELLYRALAAPIGIQVEVSDVTQCRNELVRCRQLTGNKELDRLQFRTNPLDPDGSLWIIKGPKDNGEDKKAPQAGQAKSRMASRATTLEDLFGEDI